MCSRVKDVYGGKIGFIGGGNMTNALVESFVKSGLVLYQQIFVADHKLSTVEKFKALGCEGSTNNLDIVKNADFIICAVKPVNVKDAIVDMSKHLSASKIFVSVCAGINLDYFQNCLGSSVPIIRVMTNTPCSVKAGATAFCCTQNTSDENIETFKMIFGSCSEVHYIKESQIDAVTGLSGSGPAYVYMIIEALSDAGVKNGLPPDVATALATQTVYGGALMVKKTGLHPSVLIEQVTSPGGTTIAGIAVLEKEGLRSALINAVDCAIKRAQEIGKLFSCN